VYVHAAAIAVSDSPDLKTQQRQTGGCGILVNVDSGSGTQFWELYYYYYYYY
jgi:hypothetical protein